MKAVRCINGHYYDSDIYVVCPHCGAAQEKNASAGDGRSIAGFVPRRGSDTRQISAEKVSSSKAPQTEGAKKENTEDSAAAGANGSGAKKQSLRDVVQSELQKSIQESSAAEEGKTLSYFSMMSGMNQPAASSPETAPSVPYAASGVSPESAANSNNQIRESENRQASSHLEGSGFFGSEADPVVGILVSVSGPHRGEVFGIYAGLNSIGRSERNRICLRKDFSISREKHSLLTYEPKMRRFYIERGDSSGLTYVNGEFITETTPLKERDYIELGGSTFLFLPICNESFSWEDYLNKG